MSPADLLAAASAAGLAVRAEAGALRVRGPQAAIAQWAPRLKEHKPELIALLQSQAPAGKHSLPASAAPVKGQPLTLPPCESWEERAAILEFDAGLTRTEAEEQATCRRWLIHHPDGWRDHTCTPPASLAELRRWYPAALAILPCDDDAETWGGANTPETGEPGHPDADPGVAFYAKLFAGMADATRAFVTLNPTETHRAVVAGLIDPAATRGAVLLATRDPEGRCALFAIPADRYDPFKVLALLESGMGTVH